MSKTLVNAKVHAETVVEKDETPFTVDVAKIPTLKPAFRKDGTVTAATYEYGNCFLIVAGLLNFLVILDAFDIAKGRK